MFHIISILNHRCVCFLFYFLVSYCTCLLCYSSIVVKHKKIPDTREFLDLFEYKIFSNFSIVLKLDCAVKTLRPGIWTRKSYLKGETWLGKISLHKTFYCLLTITVFVSGIKRLPLREIMKGVSRSARRPLQLIRFIALKYHFAENFATNKSLNSS